MTLVVSSNSDAKNIFSFPTTDNVEYELDFEKVMEEKEEECKYLVKWVEIWIANSVSLLKNYEVFQDKQETTTIIH